MRLRIQPGEGDKVANRDKSMRTRTLTIILQAVLLSRVDSTKFRAKLSSVLWDQSPADHAFPPKAYPPNVAPTGGEAVVTCRN